MSLSGEDVSWPGELPAEASPGTESGIAEVFKLLRGEGLEDKQIINEIFRRDLDADVNEIHRISGLDKMEIGRLKGNITQIKLKEARIAKKSEKREETAPDKKSAHDKSSDESSEESLMKGEVDANKVLERILNHPDVPEKVRRDIILLAEDTPGGIHPQALVGILLGYKGMTQNLSNFLAMRYSNALVKATEEGKIQNWPMNPSMGSGQGQQSGWGSGGSPGWGRMDWGTQGWGQGGPQMPSSGPPPGWTNWGNPSGWGNQGYGYTERDLQRLRQDWDKEKKLENLERTLTDLVKDLPNLIRSASPQAETQYEEVTEYVDKDGNLVDDPTKAFKLRTIKRPIIAPRESSDVRELKEKVESMTQAFQERKEADLNNTIKALSDKVDNLRTKPEESLEMRELKTQLEQTRTTLGEMKDAMASKDREQLLKTIEGLDQRISHLSTTSGEWKTDEAKLIATELSELGTIVKEIAKKDRMGLVERVFLPETSNLPEGNAPEGARSEIVEGLRKLGYTGRLIERQ